MDATGVAILLITLFLLSLPAGWWLWQFRRVEHAKRWPSTEATIRSGDKEVASTPGRGVLRLPVFAFSYKVNEEYYSGYFTLMPNMEPGESLIKRMIDRKLRVQYDPRRPSVYFIPDSVIEGCDVRQKMDPHLVSVYPTD
ncbi:MAG TPA: hypothetical protein VGS10_15480 [Terracidiphilus sp.]|nr:hypothetical protein [Terracidiphilus sp.]